MQLNFKKKKYWLQKIEVKLNQAKISNISKSSQTKFYMQLNSIRKKKKKLLVAKNRGLQLNQAKILRM
jgi:hypothetical protein